MLFPVCLVLILEEGASRISLRRMIFFQINLNNLPNNLLTIIQRIRIPILLMFKNNQQKRIKMQKQEKLHNHQQTHMHMTQMINSLSQRNMITIQTKQQGKNSTILILFLIRESNKKIKMMKQKRIQMISRSQEMTELNNQYYTISKQN